MALSRAFQALGKRGLVAECTSARLGDDLAGISARTRLEPPLSVYAGFDPTGPSLHLGHLAVLLSLKRFQAAGLRPVLLVCTRMRGFGSAGLERHLGRL